MMTKIMSFCCCLVILASCAQTSAPSGPRFVGSANTGIVYSGGKIKPVASTTLSLVLGG